MRRVPSLFLLSLFVAMSLSAATFDRVNDSDLLIRADLVVVATVLDSSSHRIDGRGIVTDSRLFVEDVLKGEAPAADVIVRQLGGVSGETILMVPGSASYAVGTRVLAFLRAAGDGTYYTAYMGLGKFRFADGDLLVRDADNIETTSEGAFDPRPARQFLDALRAGKPDDAPRSRAIAMDAISELPPSLNSAGSYSITGGPSNFPFRWLNCETSCTITFILNGTQGALNTSTAFSQASAAWEAEPSGINMVNGGTGSETDFDPDVPPDPNSSLDGANNIIFSYSGSMPGVCDGGLGCGYVWASTPSHNYRGDNFYKINETDILILPGAGGSQTGLEAVLAHELGHGLGFRHSNVGSPSSSNALMNSSVSTGSGALLKQWDKDAVAEVYANGAVCTNVDILSHTPNATVPWGTQVTLSVGLNAATSPVSYQWYAGVSGDTSNPVATSTTYKPVITNTAGQSYWVKVTNCGGTGTENSQTMTQTAQPCDEVNITKQPLSQRVQPHGQAVLTVDANGSDDLTYKWYEGIAPDTSKPAPGTNNKKTYTTPMLTSGKSYWVRVKNDCPSEEDSTTATIAVGTQCLPATATPVATVLTASLGGSATMVVTAAGDAPYTYQWYQGLQGDETTPIAGAIDAMYTAGPFNTPGTFNFWVKVENICGKANSATIVVTVECNASPSKPQIFVPASSPRSFSYEVKWTGDLVLSPTFELQESTSPDFSTLLRNFTVAGLEQTIPAHTEVLSNTRFYYRVRPVSICTQQPGEYSRTQSTLVMVPQPKTSRSFNAVVPFGSTEPYLQELFVAGFGETALPGDTFAVTSDAPWMIITPGSGPLPADGATVVMTASPGPLDVGTSIATITVVRTQGPGKFGTNNGASSTSLPFSMSLVTPVTPDPRSGGAPEGTLIIPAVAHADGFNTRFQSDVRIANISSQEIEYEMTYTPSGLDGSQVGLKTSMVIPSNESRSFDDIVNNSYASGVGGNNDFSGTLEIRPLNAPDAFSTIASSRTYAVSQNELGELVGTLGQFIPALNINDFVGDVSLDSLSKISLQQIANSLEYRTNVGLVEGAGQAATALVKLLDGDGNVIAQATKDLPPYGHFQSGLGALMVGIPQVSDGRLEVETTSASGKVTAYASVLDNATNDPLLVFPEQAGRISSSTFVLPGVADVNSAFSNFHSDTRIFNGGNSMVTLSLGFEPMSSFTTPRPANVEITLLPGEVEVIDNTLMELWGLTQTAGALHINTVGGGNASIVATARTASNVATGGTNGQFIPAMTASDAVGMGERALTVLQLEQSPQYRTNFGLVEVTGAPVIVEVTAFKPDSKLSVAVPIEIPANGYTQYNAIFHQFFGADTNIYGGRISVRVIGGEGRIAAYGSVVDMRTSDPTYVPAQ